MSQRDLTAEELHIPVLTQQQIKQREETGLAIGSLWLFIRTLVLIRSSSARGDEIRFGSNSGSAGHLLCTIQNVCFWNAAFLLALTVLRLPCRWQNDTIIVFDDIKIVNPYTPQNVSGGSKEALSRVQKIVSAKFQLLMLLTLYSWRWRERKWKIGSNKLRSIVCVCVCV